MRNRTLLLTAAASLAVSGAGAFEMSDLDKVCSGKDVTVRLAADTGDGSEEREAKRKEQGRSTDDQVADHVLAGRAEVKRDGEGSTLSWKRPSGSRGQADCRRRISALEKRFPGRLSFMDPAKGGMKEVAKKAVEPIPAELRKTPADAGKAARFFDVGGNVGEAGDVGGAVVAAVPLPRPAPSNRPRAEMPSYYNRPYGAPPAPGTSAAGVGSALIQTAIGAYKGGGTHVKVAGMTIDTDGDLSNGDPHLAAMARRDPYRQAETSVRYSNGRSLDPTRVPYVVIPIGYSQAKNGELVMVEYNGRSTLAVVGDRGPKHRFGEGSMALAVALGINPSGTTGGVGSGVRYTFLGTTVGRPSSEAAMLAAMRERSLAMQAQGLLAGK